MTLDGWGHVAIGQSRCIADVLTGYLINPRRPIPDRTCPTDITPFAATQRADLRSRALQAINP